MPTNELKPSNRTVEYLYDITVEEDHSFIIEGLISHNCHFEFENTQLDELAQAFGGKIRPKNPASGHTEIGVEGEPETFHQFTLYPDMEKSFKGGAGSGNFGHSGRPGEVGGSNDVVYAVSGPFVQEGTKTAYVIRAKDALDHDVGFIQLLEYPDALKVNESNVQEEFRRKGIGTELYKQAIEVARRVGKTYLISSYSVSDKASLVWKKLGADVVKEAESSTGRFRITVADFKG